MFNPESSSYRAKNLIPCIKKKYLNCITSFGFCIQDNLTSIYENLVPWPSLKLDFEYFKFDWAHCFNNLQIWTKCTLKHIFKILVHKTTAKVILVRNFDLRLFSVYGHGARTERYQYMTLVLSIYFIHLVNGRQTPNIISKHY